MEKTHLSAELGSFVYSKQAAVVKPSNGKSFINGGLSAKTYWFLAGNGWEWMGMGVAGIIIHMYSDHSLFP